MKTKLFLNPLGVNNLAVNKTVDGSMWPQLKELFNVFVVLPEKVNTVPLLE